MLSVLLLLSLGRAFHGVVEVGHCIPPSTVWVSAALIDVGHIVVIDELRVIPRCFHFWAAFSDRPVQRALALASHPPVRPRPHHDGELAMFPRLQLHRVDKAPTGVPAVKFNLPGAGAGHE